MMMYHPIKFNGQKIISSADMVETVTFDQMCPHCHPELQDSKPIFLHETWPMMLYHNTKFGYIRFSAEKMSSRWTFTEKLNLFCDLDLDHNRAIQSFHKTIHLMMMYHQTKFSCKKISSSDHMLKSDILIILSLTVTLTLKTANQSFRKTIWLIMMHHHTKFGTKSKRFSNSENIIWTFINIVKFCCDLDLEHNNPISP